MSVRKVYCDKTADSIRMPFGIVSRVGRGMGVLDGVHVPQGKKRFWRSVVPIGFNSVFFEHVHALRRWTALDVQYVM